MQAGAKLPWVEDQTLVEDQRPVLRALQKNTVVMEEEVLVVGVVVV